MGYPPLEDLLPKSNYSIYKLVRMASKRATELADGKRKLIEMPSLDKSATIALEEIQQAKIVLDEVSESFKPEASTEKAASQDETQEEAV